MGYAIAHRLAVRVKFLQQYLQFINYIETEIRYAQRVLSEITNGYQNNTEFKNFLVVLKENLQSNPSFSEAWQNAVQAIPDSYGLLRQDKDLIREFGKELGSTDVMGQIALCSLNKSLISAVLETAKEEKIKKSKLYFMLGSSFGMCVAIILL